MTEMNYTESSVLAMEYQQNYSISAFVDHLQTKHCCSSSGRKHHHFRWLFWSPENHHPDLSLKATNTVKLKQLILLKILQLILQLPYPRTNDQPQDQISDSRDNRELHRLLLVQFWAPTTHGGRVFLTSSDQPFAVDWLCKGLCWYRKQCCSHGYFIDADDKEDELGPPGRVFRTGLPESSPDLRLYSGKEHPLRNQALGCGLRGYLVLPVFEMHEQDCIGVLEFVVFSAGYINIINEVEEGLKIADLRWGASNINQPRVPPSYLPNENEDERGRQRGLKEIEKMFDVLKTSPQLFLAQAWISTKQCAKANDGTTPRANFFELGKHKLFVEDDDHYNSSTTHFLKASKLHALILGNGISGAFLATYESFFCPNICNFSITEYPLVHYARLARVTASFSISLQSRDNIYVLQFFLLPGSSSNVEHSPRSFLPFLMAIMEQHLISFKLLSGKVLGEEVCVMTLEFSKDNYDFCELGPYPLRFETLRYEEGLERLRAALRQLQFGGEAMEIIMEQNINKDTNADKLEKGALKIAREKQKKISICYEDLEPYFGKTLRDAEKGLGVSRSTLKRACRDNNITRWPSIERNKANPSLFRNKSSFHGNCHLDFLIIEADYEGDTIKFKLPFSSGMEKTEEEIGRRLKLNVNSFKMKYMDENGKWILLTCDDDLEFCEERLASSGGNLVRLLVQL